MLTISQAAKTLGVSEKSIRRYIHAGRLKAATIKGNKGNEYRINREDLKKLEKPERGRPEKKDKKIPVKKQVARPQKKVGDPSPKAAHVDSTAELLNAEIKSDFIQIKELMDGLEQKRDSFEKEKEIVKHEQSDSPPIMKSDNDLIKLYQDLLRQFALAQNTIGRLESQLRQPQAHTNHETTATIKKLEYRCNEQERLIQELYQTIRELERGY